MLTVFEIAPNLEVLNVSQDGIVVLRGGLCGYYTNRTSPHWLKLRPDWSKWQVFLMRHWAVAIQPATTAFLQWKSTLLPTNLSPICGFFNPFSLNKNGKRQGRNCQTWSLGNASIPWYVKFTFLAIWKQGRFTGLMQSESGRIWYAVHFPLWPGQ